MSNPFKFTGQYFDSEIEEYYLRARQYDPHIARFTSRDPVFGKFKEPLTLHVYLYCLNDPVNRTDPTGEFGGIIASLPTRAKDAVASVGAKMWAFSKIQKAVMAANAAYEGWMNAMFYADDISFLKAFGIGALAGATEAYIAMAHPT